MKKKQNNISKSILHEQQHPILHTLSTIHPLHVDAPMRCERRPSPRCGSETLTTVQQRASPPPCLLPPTGVVSGH